MSGKLDRPFLIIAEWEKSTSVENAQRFERRRLGTLGDVEFDF